LNTTWFQLRIPAAMPAVPPQRESVFTPQQRSPRVAPPEIATNFVWAVAGPAYASNAIATIINSPCIFM
jgi:hypothetical protein